MSHLSREERGRMVRASNAILTFLRGGMTVDMLEAPQKVARPSVARVSALHSRRWCSYHNKVCCFNHGKHKNDRVFPGKPRPSQGEPYA